MPGMPEPQEQQQPDQQGTADQPVDQGGQVDRQSLLKVLLRTRHLQTHSAFAAEYEKTARRTDRSLIGSAPGREQLQRWLSGRVKTQPRPHHCRVLELMFPGHSARELLAPYDPTQPHASSGPTTSTETGQRIALPPLQLDPAGQPSDLEQPAGTVRLGSETFAASLVTMVWRGPDQLDAALDSGTVGPGRLASLDAEADRLGVRVVKVPPASLLAETLVHVASVRTLLGDRQPAAVQQQLARIGSKLSTVVAEILWNENQFVLARRWYQSAMRSAMEARDRLLSDIALAGSTYLPAYADDPRGVLANVDSRLQSGPTPSPAVAWLWGFKAKAHAALGERLAFEHAMDAAWSTMDRCPAELIRPGIFSVLPEKLSFYEAHGRIDLRDADGAARAATKALARYDLTDTTEPALVRFEHASALAQTGELGQACQLALRTMRDPHTYRAAAVVIRARAFDRMLGPTSRPIREWREFLTEVRPPDPTALASGM